jgi:hypothetical protein
LFEEVRRSVVDQIPRGSPEKVDLDAEFGQDHFKAFQFHPFEGHYPLFDAASKALENFERSEPAR